MFFMITFITAAALFLFLEGLCSVIFIVKSLHLPRAEDISTKRDSLLGWVSLPNVFIKNMYGEGIYLKTNSQGFRNNTDFPASVPEGKIRIISSGDSFTLGYGVDNDHTWCHLLESMDDRLEVVNMGQGSYGIGQAYLWYMRDGIKLKHQIHIFGVIGDDFKRFEKKNGWGYGRPDLKWQNNSLVVRNIPVPARSFYAPWLADNSREIFAELKALRALRFFYNKLMFDRERISETNKINAGRALAVRIFEELLKIDKLNNSTLIVVYLPVKRDLTENASAGLRKSLASALSERKIFFWDLVDDFKKTPGAEINKLFISKNKYYSGSGHYTERGNQLVAGVIYKKLLPLF